MKHKTLCAAAAFVAALFSFTAIAFAAPEPDIQLSYYGEATVSAYYPAEDTAHPNNYKGTPLTELAGEIVAVPAGSELLGKYLLIEYDCDGETEYLLRKAEDTGCKTGRIDLLVEDESEMSDWGLREATIYVLEEDEWNLKSLE